MTATARQIRPRRRGMKVLAALLSTVCALELLIAFEHIPMQGWRMPDWSAPTWVAPGAPRLELGPSGDGVRERLTDLGERARAAVWPRPALEAAEADVPLRGAFAGTAEGPSEIAFDGALVRLGPQTWRTEPVRIVAGETAYAEGETFARRLRAAPDAQIELRRVVPDDAADEAEVAATPLCGGDRPGVIALLHRPDQVDVMLFRAGAEPNARAAASGLCGVWTFARP